MNEDLDATHVSAGFDEEPDLGDNGEDKKDNRKVIIAIAAAVVVCCCCSAVALGYYAFSSGAFNSLY